jgi:hypothetical protein
MNKNNKNDSYNSGITKNSFNLNIKICGYKDNNFSLKSITSLLSSLSKKVNNIDSDEVEYPEDIEYSEDYSLQIDKDNYIINPIYFYDLIIKKIDFGNTYSFIIGHNDRLLTRNNVPFGSIIYTLPEISYKSAKLIDNNKAINLELNELNKDFIFRLPKRYRDLDVNNKYLESFISYKMLLRYEILKLQWEFTSIIKNSDLVRKARKDAHERGDLGLDLKIKYYKVIK